MREFKYIDDIVSWLVPMDYQGYWAAIAPFNIEPQPRDHCDQQISDGEVDEATVLDVLKTLTRIELTQIYALEWKPSTPWVRLVE